MKITFLGTGTSTGVPQIGCSCKVCRSTDARDKRLRTSVLVETEQTRILLDCGPDFRQQILPLDFRRIDAVLLTHEHYDHVGGIDDLRPFGVFGDVQLYASERTGEQLRQSLPYCFVEHKYPGVPQLRLHAVRPHEAFRVGELQVTPIEVMHARLLPCGAHGLYYRHENDSGQRVGLPSRGGFARPERSSPRASLFPPDDRGSLRVCPPLMCAAHLPHPHGAPYRLACRGGCPLARRRTDGLRRLGGGCGRGVISDRIL